MHEVAPDALAITTSREGDALSLALYGELDLGTAPLLERALRKSQSKSHRVVVDLRGLEFMDSTGVKTLLSAVRLWRGNGCRLTLRRGPRQVQRLFELTHTQQSFTFEDDNQDR